MVAHSLWEAASHAIQEDVDTIALGACPLCSCSVGTFTYRCRSAAVGVMPVHSICMRFIQANSRLQVLHQAGIIAYIARGGPPGVHCNALKPLLHAVYSHFLGHLTILHHSFGGGRSCQTWKAHFHKV